MKERIKPLSNKALPVNVLTASDDHTVSAIPGPNQLNTGLSLTMHGKPQTVKC